MSERLYLELKGKLEALLFASVRPLSVKTMARLLQLDVEEAEKLIHELGEDLQARERGTWLRQAAGGWRLETKPEHNQLIRSLSQAGRRKPLTAQALETLAIVALKQPVTAEQVNAVRGVASLATLQTLQKRKLIAPAPQGSGVGRATQWRTTQEFLTEFGISRIEEIYATGKIDQIFGSDSGTFS